MAVTSKATAKWHGTLAEGKGSVNFDSSGIANFPVNWKARSESHESTTNPEELLGAAHATCYSMALSHKLATSGFVAETIETSSSVTFQPGTGITGIELKVSAVVPGLSEADFQKYAEETKTGCPVSQALSSVPMTLNAELLG